MNHRNYQKELDQLLEQIIKENQKKTLFLHCCCAPCSSYVLEYLSAYFEIVLYFYNPNITEPEEYKKRKAELVRLVEVNHYPNPVRLLDGDYDNRLFFEMAEGLEKEPECGRRCFRCYDMRLRKTAEMAAKDGADYFCTTLSISPHKKADKPMEDRKCHILSTASPRSPSACPLFYGD